MRWVTNVRLPSTNSCGLEQTLWRLLLDDQDKVKSVNPMTTLSSISGVSWGGDWISPMGIDLQINGGLGLSFTDLGFDQLPILFDLLDQLWIDGVEAICPTLVSCDTDALRLALEVFRYARQKHEPHRCILLGAHLEGPFLARDRCGAHSLNHLCEPSLQALLDRISGFEAEISLMTLAPELPGAEEVIKRLKRLGIVVALGHSEADGVIARCAFENGVSMLTHTFNAMSGLLHRDPGPVGEAIANGQIALGLIADGVHVHPQVAVMLQKLASHNLVLVSDALSPYGLGEGQHTWDKRGVNVENGACCLENGKLAGATLPLLEGCMRLAKWGGDPAASISSATITGRGVLGNEQDLVALLMGKRLSDFLRWHWNKDLAELSWQRAA